MGKRKGLRGLAWLAAIVMCVAAGTVLAVAAGGASASTTPTVVSLTTPGFTSFTVPPSVTSLTVAAVGGAGGSVVGLAEGGGYTKVVTPGGHGGTASETVAVEPGELLDIMVAGDGGNDFTAGGGEGGQGGVGLGGSGGERSGGRGGGGGGESFVMGVGFALVAGGGGGAGDPYGAPEAGSLGGDAESEGATGGTDASPGCSLTGVNEGGGGGGAGTGNAGGAEGAEAFVETSRFGPTPGVAYEGGRGGGGSEGGGASGGGGGGGYYGGGGGGGGGPVNEHCSWGPGGSGGGGGGGSSYAPHGATGIAEVGALPSVTLTYTPQPVSTTPTTNTPTSGSPSTTSTGSASTGASTAANTSSQTTAPTLTAVSMSSRRFRVAQGSTAITATPLGTIFRFSLSSSAHVRITFTSTAAGRRSGGRCVASTATLVRNHVKRCTRAVTVGTLTRVHEPGGANSIPFTGRLGHLALSPRSYRATLSASNAAGSSAPVSLTFTVVG